jgi:hypothetical protein
MYATELQYIAQHDWANLQPQHIADLCSLEEGLHELLRNDTRLISGRKVNRCRLRAI